MTIPGRPHLKSLTRAGDQPHPATPSASQTAVGGRKDVAEGVPSALRPDPHQTTVSGIRPGLHISTHGLPVADWLCDCGHHERARGRSAVTGLAGRVRVGQCPHVTATERRNAA